MLWVGFNHFGNTLACESFLMETPFDSILNFGMSWVYLIEEVFEGEIQGAKVVTEVLRKDPANV